jgi:hypothetical protein
MIRICLFSLLILLLIFGSAHADGFIVREICQDNSGAVILDPETGTEWDVKVGDEIQGWKIIEIDGTGVSVLKEPRGDMPYAIVNKLDKMSEFGIPLEP